MADEVLIGASGIVAACDRPLTAVTLISAIVEPVRKFRRDNMGLVLF
jgi:hypothetical protein